MSPLVLVIDDDVEIRQLVRKALQLEGYRITEAADGWQAIDAVHKEDPNLVILDSRLPGIDGEAVSVALRMAHGVKILVVTGRDDAGRVADRAGAYGYLTKPFSMTSLIEKVRQGLEG